MWLQIVSEVVALVAVAQPIVLNRDPVSVLIVSADDSSLRSRIDDIRRDPERNLILRLGSIEVEGPADVSWEVYVGSPAASRGERGPRLVGILSPYGMASPAEFSFPLDDAIPAGAGAIEASFVPTSGVVAQGQAPATQSRSNIRIGAVSLRADRARSPDR